MTFTVTGLLPDVPGHPSFPTYYIGLSMESDVIGGSVLSCEQNTSEPLTDVAHQLDADDHRCAGDAG